MKLKLKHLTPYLPYGLAFMYQKKPYRLLQLNVKYDQKPMWIEGYDGENLVSVFPEGCKPLLKPMSDLDIDWFVENIDVDIIDFSYTQSTDFTCEVEDRLIGWISLSLGEFNKFFEHHFDVFGLIEKGLALDVNTLK